MKFELKLAGIELISKFLLQDPSLGESECYFNYLVDLKLNDEQKVGAVITDISILSKPDNRQLANFKTMMVFEFPKFEDIFVLVGEKTYSVPVDLEIMLKSAGLATTRGIMFSELRGTYLHTAPFPLVDIATPILERQKKSEESKKE
jgi:hypothetical protein